MLFFMDDTFHHHTAMPSTAVFKLQNSTLLNVPTIMYLSTSALPLKHLSHEHHMESKSKMTTS